MAEQTINVGFAPDFVYISRDDGIMEIYDSNYSANTLRYYVGTSENGRVDNLPNSTGLLHNISGSNVTFINRSPYVLHIIAIG